MTLVGGKGIFILVLKFCPTESKSRKQRLSIECIMWEVILRSLSYFGMSAVWPCPRLYGVMTLKWPEGMAPCELCQYLKVDGVENGKMLTLLVQETEYFGFEGSMPCLLMHWLLKSPEHQQTWYWLCRTDNMYCCFTVNFIYLGEAKFKQWFKCWCIFYNL